MDAQTTLPGCEKIRESYLQPLSGRLAAIEESIHAFCEEFRKAAVAVGDCRKFVGAGSTARACAGPRTEKDREPGEPVRDGARQEQTHRWRHAAGRFQDL